MALSIASAATFRAAPSPWSSTTSRRRCCATGPSPYYGTHVLLHVEDAAGRPRVRAAADTACRFRRRLVAGRRRLDLDRHQLRGAGGAGPAGGLAPVLPRSIPRGDGRTRRPAARLRAVTTRRTGTGPSAPGRSTSRSASSATPKKSGAAPWRPRASNTRTSPASPSCRCRTSAPSQVTSIRSATKIRSASRPSRAAASSSLPGQGRPIKAGEFILGYPGEAGVPLPMPQPGRARPQRHLRGLRKYQSRVGAFNRFLREHGSTEQERELLAAKLVGRWRSGAPADARARRRRPGARRGPAPEQRLHLRERSARPAGAVRQRTSGA